MAGTFIQSALKIFSEENLYIAVDAKKLYSATIVGL